MVERDKPKTETEAKKPIIPWLKDVKEKKIVNPFGFRWSEQKSKEKKENENGV